jgi:hypothetical protein
MTSSIFIPCLSVLVLIKTNGSTLTRGALATTGVWTQTSSEMKPWGWPLTAPANEWPKNANFECRMSRADNAVTFRDAAGLVGGLALGPISAWWLGMLHSDEIGPGESRHLQAECLVRHSTLATRNSEIGVYRALFPVVSSRANSLAPYTLFNASRIEAE